MTDTPPEKLPTEGVIGRAWQVFATEKNASGYDFGALEAAINAAYPLLVAENMRLRAFVDWTISKDFNSRDLPIMVAALTRDSGIDTEDAA